MSEIKPRSMRMSDENYTKLQTLSENRSLDETVAFLLKIYEKDEERNSLGVQSVKLDELDELLGAVRSNYAAALHTCTNAKEVVRSEFNKQLTEKEELLVKQQSEIVALQKQLLTQKEESQKEISRLQAESQEYQNTVQITKQYLEENQTVTLQKQQAIDVLTKALTASEEKASQVELLKEQIELLKKKEEESTYFAKELKKAKEEIEALTLQKAQIQKEAKESLEKEITSLTARHTLELEQVKSQTELLIREAKLVAATQVNEIREKYQEKIFELLEKERPSNK